MNSTSKYLDEYNSEVKRQLKDSMDNPIDFKNDKITMDDWNECGSLEHERIKKYKFSRPTLMVGTEQYNRLKNSPDVTIYPSFKELKHKFDRYKK